MCVYPSLDHIGVHDLSLSERPSNFKQNLFPTNSCTIHKWIAFPIWFHLTLISCPYTSQIILILFFLQGLVDLNKPPEMISGNMTAGRWNTLGFGSQVTVPWINYKLSLMPMGFLQPCVCILDFLWGLHGWYSRATTCFWHAMPPTKLFSSIICLDVLRLRGKTSVSEYVPAHQKVQNTVFCFFFFCLDLLFS